VALVGRHETLVIDSGW